MTDHEVIDKVLGLLDQEVFDIASRFAPFADDFTTATYARMAKRVLDAIHLLRTSCGESISPQNIEAALNKALGPAPTKITAEPLSDPYTGIDPRYSMTVAEVRCAKDEFDAEWQARVAKAEAEFEKEKAEQKRVAVAKAELAEEDRKAEEARRSRVASPEYKAKIADIDRRSNLPSEHPEHLCGMPCDGQDGSNSYCARLRRKLFGGGG